MLATTLGDPAGSDAVRKIYLASGEPAGRRRQALDALVAGARCRACREAVAAVLADAAQPHGSARPDAWPRWAARRSLGSRTLVLANYSRFEPELQPKAIDLLTERADWAHALLDAIGRHEIPAAALNVNQVRKLLASKDETLVEKVRAQWGTLRTDRNPQREASDRRRSPLARRPAGRCPGRPGGLQPRLRPVPQDLWRRDRRSAPT